MSATTVALDVACGGVSTAVVSAILNPTDVIKTRRQIVGFSGASPLDMARAVARADGLRGLWLPGLQATVLRELLYSGCTKGLYPYARDAVSGEEDASLAQRALAAALTGFGGSLCANAVDVVKVQQFDSGSNRSVVAAMRDVARSEGVVRGLLVRGVSASAPRGAAIAIGEVTTYDYAKSRLARHPAFSARDEKGAEPFSLHIVTSVITGVVATTVAAPFDTIKSRVMARGGMHGRRCGPSSRARAPPRSSRAGGPPTAASRRTPSSRSPCWSSCGGWRGWRIFKYSVLLLKPRATGAPPWPRAPT